MDRMDQRRSIALGIGLQAQVLKRCPIHRQVFYDDADPSPAFALALELIRSRTPYVGPFDDDAHQLMDVLSETIGAAPEDCPECSRERPDWRAGAENREHRASELVPRTPDWGVTERMA